MLGANDAHILTIDYRGYGYSTGSPTEEGLILDGIATVNWALTVAHVAPERIVIVGQSLGTAVAVAVAEHFATKSHIDFAGIVLVAGFSDLPTVMMTYKAGGILPALSPLRPYPKIQSFFARRIKDTWPTSTRLGNLVRNSRRIDLALIHSKNDPDIPWSHCDTLFYAAANATSIEGMTASQIDGVKQHLELGAGGWTNTWTAGTSLGEIKRIKQTIVKHGGA